MKPAATFRHATADGPAYFADFLTRTGTPFVELRIDQGQPVRADAAARHLYQRWCMNLRT